MENISSDNKILQRLFNKAELSYVISDVSKAIGPIVDLMFISLFIGASGVTVMGYISPLIMMFEFIGTCIRSGARNKVSNLLGAGEIKEANIIFSESILLGVGLSLSSVIAVGIFCSQVSFVLGARDSQIFAMTNDYIYGYIIGMPFFALTRVLSPYLEMEGEYNRLNMISMMTTILDIALDAFVVFVLHGGMFEIALATSLGYIIPFFFCASFFVGRKASTVFRFSMKGITMKECCEIMRLGSPAGIVKGSNALGGMLINNLLTALNLPYLVASYGVFSQITVFVRSSWYAASDNLLSFAGILIGEEDRYSLKELQRISLIHSLIFTSIVTVLMFILAVPLANIFLKSNDPEALRMTTECIRISCLSLPFYAIVYCFNNYLMAVKRLRFNIIYSFLIECGITVPVTFFMLRITGYRGAWLSKVVIMSILSLIAAFYVYLQKEGKTYRDKMLLLPESFGIMPEDELSLQATSTDEVIELSHIAIAFALEHGADRKRAMTYGLLTEELGLFLEEHGFSDGKAHNISVRLMSKGEELIIRMRDDCKPFNMTEYYKELIESKERDAGLFIIMKRSKEVQYTNTLGTNNLIVRI